MSFNDAYEAGGGKPFAARPTDWSRYGKPRKRKKVKKLEKRIRRLEKRLDAALAPLLEDAE